MGGFMSSIVVSGDTLVCAYKIVADAVESRTDFVFRISIHSIFAAVITKYLYLNSNYTYRSEEHIHKYTIQ
jgi:hypothetical protein